MRNLIRSAWLALAGTAILACLACTSGPSGTYSDTMGSVILELKGAGKANITFGGEVQECIYTSSGNKLTLNCKGDPTPTVFTIHDDGSLTGPPGGFMPALRKK